jgi:hypothetical protein
MQVHAIDHNQVQVLCPHCDPILQFFVVEKQWFATEDQKLLGVVLYQRSSNDWAYVAFGPNSRGCYRWIAGESNIPSQIQATANLQGEMERIAESGQEVFSRPLKRLFHGIKTAAKKRRIRRVTRRAARNAPAGQIRWNPAP